MNDKRTILWVKWKTQEKHSIYTSNKRVAIYEFWYTEIHDQKPGQQIRQIMISLMEVPLSFFGALIELTPSGDHDSVTGLVSTQIPVKFVESLSAVTPRKINQYSFIQHTKMLISLIFCLKNYGKQ